MNRGKVVYLDWGIIPLEYWGLENFKGWLRNGWESKSDCDIKITFSENEAELILKYLQDVLRCIPKKVGDEINLDDIDMEDVSKFFDWLQNNEFAQTEGFEHTFALSPDDAFHVIYYLQEDLHVLSDSIEMCMSCKELFDMDSEGTCIDADTEVDEADEWGEETGKTITFPEEQWGTYCEDCRPD